MHTEEFCCKYLGNFWIIYSNSLQTTALFIPLVLYADQGFGKKRKWKIDQ